MNWRVRHVTTYRYAETVDMATHMLHLSPRAVPGQRVLAEEIRCTPTPSRLTQGTDHFGNRVTWLSIDQPHDRFEVVAEAQVETAFPLPPPAEATPPWEELAARPGPEAVEFTFPSPMLPENAAARDYAASSFPPGRPVLAGLLDLNARIRRDFTFRAGVTGIATPVSQVLAQRAGVCQDFTHLMLNGLRGLGLPARYVSGYIRTRPPPGAVARQGADQSHAWVGAWLGPAHGWVGLDPTNNLVVAEEHVVLGWGRDFSDVSPLRGIILGGGRHWLDVAVDLAPG
ncbi:transglutaminase family protein [Pseudoroseomonas wenyumeiae]|uniref:Transglutaminase family protein n=1 Tax=Teichococcus wenyumeiae TaxID=2478470 RepID=A0A3A9JUW7_9PROT|nr:transglutaminase family protein [Pseudoroseomonas wenyumeiae]RKK02799.1 transglutaminase family protein [Pseudoroseomonas wenyumeiae]RMI19999.1 transglutaminase family protein [Pseudoroseomonas wenyumeiae]